MAVKFTPHGWRPREGGGGVVDAPAGQVGEAAVVLDGAVSAEVSETGLYRIRASSSCVVRIGSGLSDASGGEDWGAGATEYRTLQQGDVIAVDAAS